MKRAEKVMKLLESQGHSITYDWVTGYNENDEAKKAIAEREGVRQAEILVYLWEKKQESARYETGMAMGLGKPVVAVGHKSFFFHLPEVVSVKSDDDIIEALDGIIHLL